MTIVSSNIKPIFIFGFGRSGTSWVSDIISRYLGRIILFEPCHPQVFQQASQYCYHHLNSSTQNVIYDHLNTCLNKQIRDRWLIRNYLSSPLDQSSEEFVNLLWDNSEIIGFKSIRLNHSILPLVRRFDAQVIFIIRHPFAVISSILRRKNFWNEFGWDNHWKMFVTQIDSLPCLTEQERTFFYKKAREMRQTFSKVVFMWGVSHIVVLRQLRSLEAVPFYYEDLYLNPYNSAKDLIRSIGVSNESIHIHPSYLFTPSMTTHRTVHELQDARTIYFDRFPDFFWEKILLPPQIETVRLLLRSLAEFSSEELSPLLDRYEI